jgi:hypothetical protein
METFDIVVSVPGALWVWEVFVAILLLLAVIWLIRFVVRIVLG